MSGDARIDATHRVPRCALRTNQSTIPDAVCKVFASISRTFGHKGGLLKRTDVHHRLSYNHKFFTSVHACAVQSHRLHVSPSWLGCSTIYVHYQKNQGAWQTHVCHVAVCMGYPIAGEVPRASVEAPWTPASLVPGSNPAARAARSGSSERRLGQRQATGGVAASHRAWAVAGRTAAGAWAHFSN